MKRPPKLVLWALAVLAVVGVLAGVAGFALVQTGWFREKVRQRIVRELETATGGRIELESLDFDWRAMRASVGGLVIHGTEAPDQAPLFNAAAVAVELKILSPFKRAVDIRSLVLTRPRIHLIVYPDGRTNLPKPKPRPRAKGTVEILLDLAVDSFRIEEGLLLFRERRFPLTAGCQSLRAQFSYEFSGPQYQGSVSCSVLQTGLAELKALPADFEAALVLERDRLRITRVRMAFKGSSLEARGRIENWSAPRASLHYAARLRFEELAPALEPKDGPRRGQADLEGDVEFGSLPWTARGRLQVRDLALESRGVKVSGIRAVAGFQAAAEAVRLRDLRVWTASGLFKGALELTRDNRLLAEGVLQDVSLADLARIAGRAGLPLDGLLSGPVRISGRILRDQLADLDAGGRLEISPAQGSQAVSGSIEARYRPSLGVVVLGSSHLVTPHSRFEFKGVLGQHVELALATSDLNELERLRAWSRGEPPRPLPLRLLGGSLSFHGALRGPLENPEFAGHLRINSFELEGRRFELLEADLEASSGSLHTRAMRLARPGLSLAGEGRLALRNWAPDPAGPIASTLTLVTHDVEALTKELGLDFPVSGELSAKAKVSGTWDKPRFEAQLELNRASAYQQPLERLAAQVRYGAGLLEVLSSQARLGTGRLRFSGTYRHAPGDLRRGRLRFRLDLEGALLSSLKVAARELAGVDANLAADLDGELQLGSGPTALRSLAGKATLARLSVDNKPLGGLTLNAATAGAELIVTVRGKMAGAAVEGQSRCKLDADYPLSGTVSFTRMQFATLLARLGVAGAAANRGRNAPPAELPFEGFMEGKLRFEGAALTPASWKGTLELPVIELRPVGLRAENASLYLRNQGPVTVEFNAREARIRQARLTGKDATLALSGGFLFGSRYPFNLRLQGGLNLALLGELDRNLRAGGILSLDASLRGRLARPDLYGRLEFREASLNYGDLPNGLDKLNGVVFLYRDRATIEKLTAQSGGGTVNLEGFLTFGDPPNYRLQLQATEMRVRYPEGVSSTVNATLALSGAGDQGVVSGDLTVMRAAFHPQTDLGSMLARSAQTFPAPPESRWLRGMRLDVHIRTAPQVRLETSLTRSIQAEADLRLRGNLSRPALLGRALISQGEVLFFGNQYSIDSGEILFVNPSRIEPLVNLHLRTRVRGVEVSLNINGPLNKTTVTYRSDPPLPFSDIVALLATGRAPTTSPGLVGARSQFAQSWEQAGAGALVSQAITSPLAGRLQRFLGVSRLKIDPSVRGVDNTPEARLTLEQQLSQDLTVVYITNLTRTQQQTIRLEWDFTRNWSALAVREANGLFGVDFLYKRQFK